MTLLLSPQLVHAMWDHVREEHPNEATGIITRGRLLNEPTHYRMHNVARDPRTQYAWGEQETRELFDGMDADNSAPWVIYHSHPETDPTPSTTDEQAAWYVGVHYVILSSAAGLTDPWLMSYMCTEPGVLVPEDIVVQ